MDRMDVALLILRALIGVMLVAGVTAHRKNGFFVFRDGYEYVLFIAVASLVPAVAGPGRASIEHAIGGDVSGRPGGALAAGLGVTGGAALLGATYRPPARARQPEPAPEST